MRSTFLKTISRTAALAGAGILLVAGVASPAAAVDVYLKAESFTKSLPDGAGGTESVPMWGFASCDPTFTTCDSVGAPGPQIALSASDNLTIHLSNTLPVPVSIVIPGQAGGGVPVPAPPDARGRIRVQSFTHAAAASGGTATYTWLSLRPGTYLYQSGTQPSIQVPMGLYGALVVGPATLTTGSCTTGQPAYDTVKSCYDADTVLLISEVDALQNGRVAEAAASLGTPTQTCQTLDDWVNSSMATTDYPCTVDYNPTYFLVNGGAGSTVPAGDGTTASSVLLRFLNAGLRSHTPAIVGLEMGLVAEDGNPYPGLTRKQNEVLLPAGKTSDVLVAVPADNVTFALFDRGPVSYSNVDSTDPALPTGSLTAQLQVGTGSEPPGPSAIYAVDDAYTVTEDTPYPAAAPGVLFNDVGLASATVAVVSGPANGTLLLNSDGSFTYTPNENFSGADGFTYSASLAGNSYPANVTLNVGFANDAPVAAADGPYVNTIGTTITVDAAHGVLGNDSDPDGDAMTAVIEGTLPAGLTLNPDGSFTYTGGTPITFQYRADDGALQSDPATVTLNINPVANIALTVQDPNLTPVTEYRWTVEEDAMWQPDPSIVPPPADTLATNFHRSYMPVVAQGSGADEFAQLALDPLKHYYVSVLPADAATGNGHTIGGARIPPGTTALTVNVNNQPLPYAQISVFVFEDNSPTNGAVDGAETGLGGFQITLEDAGGRYGIAAGMMSLDADGNPLTNSLDCFGGTPPPMGVILSCPDTPANRAAGLVGQALIKNLFPGKYGVITTAPTGGADPVQWVQTSTIEGTKVIDAWVKAGEPPFFQEFGPAGWHVFVGFVSPERLVNPGGTYTVTGRVTNLHMSRPPDQTLWDSTTYDALAHTRPWVGLNSVGGIGPNIAAVQATLNNDGTATFEIPNVPDGSYQLVVWDSFLDQVIAYRGVTLPGGGAVGNVPVFQWFARLENNVFLDDGCASMGGGGIAGDGIRQECEAGMPEQAVNLRWRDGTVYQSFPTDMMGFVPFDQVFPFFHWLVAEVDYTRFKATGLTVTVDGGGDVTDTGFVLNPQVQADSTTSRTETGPVLTQGFQGFLGQTSIFDWGKAPYGAKENGGISGIVYYASTRAESDPRLGVGEPWEPGVPRVKVRLYREVAASGGGTALALVKETETDSWDDNLPTGCPGFHPLDAIITGGPADKCYDGLRNFNQIRPAVFDGGYAFMDITPGKYVVEVVPPPGYDLVKEEDVNVGFGDVFANAPAAVMIGPIMLAIVPDPATVLAAQAAEPGLAQPPCVGTVRPVPSYLSLFPSEMIEAPFAGADRPLCDRKQVILSDQGQAAADFFLFTGAPIAGHFAGMILDDTAQEFNPLSPQFGEKWAPPFVPVSIRDHLGREISRTYSDQWGRMNGLVPSTFTANMPSPSGYSPAMLMTCMNDPGPIPDPANPGQSIIDPQYNPAYSNFCYTFQYMPGATTYLDTPVLPVSAFASGYNPPDCALPDGTPSIRRVDGDGPGPLVAPGGILTIHSLGTAVQAPNPAYEGPLATGPAAQKTIPRDFGFGAQGPDSSVTVGGVPLVITFWGPDTIVAQAPATAMTGELVVTRDNGKSTVHSVTVTVSNEIPVRVLAGQSIQDAIDAAAPGSLVLVEPGTYDELVIMWKPVRLQGAGAGSTFINAVKRPTEKIVAWREKMDCLFGIVGTGCTQVVNALPSQPDGAAGFGTEEGAAITVVGVFDPGTGPPPAANGFRSYPSRIDGFSITGGDVGGGIYVNGYAHNLEIANNQVFGNSGSYHGGIRVGRPFLLLTGEGPFAFNRQVNIHHNAITQNGGLGGAGGGLSICTGTDQYTVSRNFVCGNFTTGDGGGIGHLGLSHNGRIEFNQVLFNQSFFQGATRSGGGLFIGGEPPEAGALTYGSGTVTADANLVQGNQAGAGHGGGIRMQFVNGRDILNSINPNNGNVSPGQWYSVHLTNNMIVNNVAGWSGGGVSMQDTARSFVVNNTIAHNDTTATVAPTFTTGDPNVSANQPGGISSEPHSSGLNAAIPIRNNTTAYRNFSNPTLSNNIVWKNRSFHYEVTGGSAGLVPILTQTAVGECDPATPAGTYWDLGVLGGGFTLSPVFSVLTDTTGYDASNISADPALVAPYCNGGRTLASVPGSMLALPALDEGGAAWIDVRYGPLTQSWPAGTPPWDYHIGDASSALNNATSAGAPNHDFDNESRPRGMGLDRGADEVGPPPGTVTFTSGAFGDVLVGSTKTIVITATVSVNPVEFYSSTSPAAPFAKTGDTCSGTTVPVGGTCTFTVTYSPTSTTTSNGSFTVTDSATGSPQTVSLSGTGVRQVAFTSATLGTLTSTEGGGTLAFGNRNGLVSSTVTITVGSVSPDPVTFGTLTVSNTTGTAFSMGADTCSGTTRAAGSTCTVTINFNAPQGNSARAGNLAVPHNGALSPTLVLGLTGS